MESIFEVADGVEYIAFTPDEADAPELHEGPWHFEPVTDYQGGGNVYSEGYPTAAVAEKAAKDFYDQDQSDRSKDLESAEMEAEI